MIILNKEEIDSLVETGKLPVEEETEDIHDEVDELIEDEDLEENEDVYDFDNEGIVSKFNIKNEDEEF